MIRLGLLLLAVLATPATAQTLSPTPPAPAAAPSRFVFEETVGIGPPESIGQTPLGHRYRIPITGGVFSGPGLSGHVLPGSADWQLARADGSVMVDADYMIETDDHVQIHVRNVGVLLTNPVDKRAYSWTAPQFEAPMGKYGWLNDAVFVSQINVIADPAHPAVRVTVYRIGE